MAHFALGSFGVTLPGFWWSKGTLGEALPCLAEKPKDRLILKMNFFPAALLNHRDSHLNALQKKASSLLVFHLFIATSDHLEGRLVPDSFN